MAKKKKIGELEKSCKENTSWCNDALVLFLYDLIQNHLPIGVIENLIGNINTYPYPRQICKGPLFTYATNLANSLREDK